MNKKFLLFSSFFILFSLLPTSANAATVGITITPPMSRITIEEGQSSYRHAIILSNHTNQTVHMSVRASDFGSLDDGGGLVFLGSSPNELWDKHRLLNWLDLSPTTFDLEPGAQQEIVVNIANDASLTPGGHYAAIIAQILSTGESTDVAINQEISSLLFVNKKGGDILGLSLNSLAADIAWWGKLAQVQVALTNKGNTHTIPRGNVTLRDPFRRIVARGILNQQSTLLLPGTKKEFTVPLISQGLAWWPGNYTVEVAYRHDGQDEYSVATKQAFLPGVVGIGVGTLVLLGLMAGGWWQIKRKR